MYQRNLKHSRVKSLFKFARLNMDSVMTVESQDQAPLPSHLNP
jgi:hypothetical protein